MRCGECGQWLGTSSSSTGLVPLCETCASNWRPVRAGSRPSFGEGVLVVLLGVLIAALLVLCAHSVGWTL